MYIYNLLFKSCRAAPYLFGNTGKTTVSPSGHMYSTVLTSEKSMLTTRLILWTRYTIDLDRLYMMNIQYQPKSMDDRSKEGIKMT